jgi:hypothetical protein
VHLLLAADGEPVWKYVNLGGSFTAVQQKYAGHMYASDVFSIGYAAGGARRRCSHRVKPSAMTDRPTFSLLLRTNPCTLPSAVPGAANFATGPGDRKTDAVNRRTKNATPRGCERRE